ncbi:MAG: RNA polymerase sigma-70 factor [Saprospiraceae bacterium]|nr:RNA polymerase sigma-70 factor [Saprospiraceae bacterium]
MPPTLDSSADRALLSALKAGDEQALRRIYDLAYIGLVRDLRRLIRDEDTCRDIAQEVFVELWRKRETLQVHTSLHAYLRRAAVNRAINFLKTQQRIDLQADDQQWHNEADTQETDAEIREQQGQLETALHQAIENLPEKCRIVFTLSRFEQMSHREIAEQLGISVKTIENQLTKAMKTLRETLTRYGQMSSIVILWLLR